MNAKERTKQHFNETAEDYNNSEDGKFVRPMYEDLVNEIFAKCDYITIHVPLTDSTKDLVNADTIANTRPTTQPSIPKAVLQDSAIELDCTIQPKKPRAKVIAIAKKPARTLPNVPL